MTKVNYYQTVTPVFTNKVVIVRGNTLKKQKNACSLDQLNIKKIAWQENGKRRVQMNIPKIAMGGLHFFFNKQKFKQSPRKSLIC